MLIKTIQEECAKFLNNVPGVEGVFVVSKDGFVISSNFHSNLDENEVGGLIASFISLAEKTTDQLNRGTLTNALIEGTKGLIVIVQADGEISLIAITSEKSQTGLVLFEMNKLAKKIVGLL